MTRKLAVTVFAMSLALVGCGSSSTTKVDGGGPDTKPAQLDAAPKLDAANLPTDTGIVTPSDAGAADAVVATDSGPVTDAVPPIADGGKDTGSVPTDGAPAKLDGSADAQSLPLDGGSSIIPDAAKDVVTSANPDVPAGGNLDVPASIVDAPLSISPDAATEAGDVLVTVITDASPDTSVTPDAATAADVVMAVDTIVAADVGDDSGSTAADATATD
jgi:hypothetical protein